MRGPGARSRLAAGVAWTGLVVACARSPEPGRGEALLVVTGPEIDALAAEVTGEPAPVAVLRAPGRLFIELPRSTRRVRLTVAGACPREATLTGAPVELQPLFHVESPPRRAGPGAAVRFHAEPACAEAQPLRARWAVVAGTLLDARLEADGRTLTGRLPPLEALLPRPLSHGPAGVSFAESGTLVAELRWDGAGKQPGGARLRTTAALGRSPGLLGIRAGEPELLGGHGYTVSTAGGSTATGLLEALGAGSLLDARGSGPLELRTPDGRALQVVVGRHDAVTLDCGRSECHQAQAEAYRRSRMHDTLARALEQRTAPGTPERARCGLACHAVGEPGTDDGGFEHAAREALGAFHPMPWDAMPRVLRRLGGVGCAACHGPGALAHAPEAWRLTRTAVCATCHDAPPRYGHVAALHASRMAVSDRLETTRADPSCARCHTTAGYLAWLEPESALFARLAGDVGEIPPSGLGCVVCHAPHPARAAGPIHRLLRTAPLPDTLEGAAVPPESAACVACHTPEEGAAALAPSSAWVWAGVGLPASAPAPPHRAVPGGCVGCHRGGPAGLERGAGHAFQVERRSCVACHASGTPPLAEDSAARLRAGLEALVQAGAVVRVFAPAAAHGRELAVEASSPHAPLAREVLLLLGDPGRAGHDPGRVARALEALRTLEGALP